MTDKDTASEIIMKHAEELFRHPHVHGLDVQHRHRTTRDVHLGVQGGPDMDPVIIIHVDPDPTTGDPLSAGLPDELDGIPCVAEASERPSTCSVEIHKRPLQAGLQMSRTGWKKRYLGTMTCFVSDIGDHLNADVNPPRILSAGHVIDPTKEFKDTMVDDNIYQPIDVMWANCVATAGTVIYGGADGAGIDAGLAYISSDVKFKNYCWTIGDITGVAKGEVGMRVAKHGRTTGKTWGKIISDSYIAKTIGGYMLKIQSTDSKGNVVNSAFAEQGDSGAPVIHGHDLVGIIHSSLGSGLASATMADKAMKALNVELYRP